MQKNNYSQFASPKNTKSFGLLPDGKEVFCYTLTNKNGMELAVINYGATITSIKVPLANLEKIDVVLGFDTLQAYVDSFNLPNAPYFGAVVGRYAGRINEGSFILNGKTIQLHKNHGNHHLHGGNDGLSKQFWSLKNRIEGKSPSITLQYISKNEEENYPGILTIEVTYLLTENNQVVVEYHAHATEDTILNVTQHSYFNLEGHQNSIEKQSLLVNAAKVLETDTLNIPTGNLLHTANCPFDFMQQKKCPTSIDTTFVIDQKAKITASLFSDKTKINMNITTNQPAVHIYVGGNCFGMIKGKENAAYHTKSGICFETQNFPDAPNHAHFPSAILKKGERYHHQTIFSFEHIN
jgi:aldose 1-epimerase